MPGIKQELAHQGAAKVTIWHLNQQQVAEIPDVAQKRDVVGGFTVALNFASQAKPELCLTDQIKRSVGQRNVFFQHRRMATPFTNPVAKDQGVIPHPQQKLQECLVASHYIAPTSSGMSKNVG